MEQAKVKTARDHGHFRDAPGRLVAIAGLLLMLYAWALLWFIAAGFLGTAVLTAMIAGFTALGVLVAGDAHHRATRGFAWGLVVLFTGPLGVVVYVWTRPPLPSHST